MTQHLKHKLIAVLLFATAFMLIGWTVPTLAAPLFLVAL